jgi:hypothetical protein
MASETQGRGRAAAASSPRDADDGPAGRSYPPPGRSAATTRRIAIHEASHTVVGRALGNEIGGATIIAGPDYSGMTWGPLGGPEKTSLGEAVRRTKSFYAEARTLVEDCLGESLSDGEGCYQVIRSRVIELLAGAEGERALCNGAEINAEGDELQARAISKVFCWMGDDAVVDSFIAYCREEARALVAAQSAAVLAVAEELIFKQTIDGVAIDAAIVRSLAKPELDRELARRADWAAVLENGSRFEKLRG